MKSENESLQEQVKVLERKVRYLTVGCIALLVFGAIIVRRRDVHADSSPQSLTVKRLAVVDDKGIERVVIAAPLPDPMVQGKRYKRAGAVSGILIYDPKGNERGGYVTNDIEKAGAFLTLDSEDSQVFMAYANPGGKDGVSVSLQSAKGDSISLTTYQQPRIEMRQSGKIIKTIPETAPVSR